MMDLKLVNVQAASLFEAYNVPLERRKILVQEVEEILHRLEKKAMIVPLAMIIDEVSKPCETPEELVCVVIAVTKRMFRKYNPLSLQ